MEADAARRSTELPLAVTLGALADLPARRAVLREKIVASPVAAARAIDGLLCAVMNGGSKARDAAVALASTFVSMRDHGASTALAALRGAALDEGLDAVAGLLLDAPPHRALARRGRLAEVCLRERHDFRFWSLAREHDTHWAYLDALRMWHYPQVLMHPSPIFIGRVLDARWLVPRNMLVIASRRPTSAAIVRTIMRSDRWLQQIEVRDALAQNPFVPTPVVLALLPSIRYPVLRHLRDAGDAHPAVARAAGLLIGLRGAPTRAGGPE